MLVRPHFHEYFEDFGLLLDDGTVHLMENGVVKVSNRLKLSTVCRINALWVSKDVKVRCAVADTPKKKTIGLQKYSKLKRNHGLYFPYPGGASVAFHQGKVSFGLDVMFLRSNIITKIERNTKVGSKKKWVCDDCDGVIEVNSGFCERNNVMEGDKLALISISERDVEEFEESQNLIANMSEVLDYD